MKDKIEKMNIVTTLLSELDNIREQLIYVDNMEEYQQLVIEFKSLSKKIDIAFNDLNLTLEDCNLFLELFYKLANTTFDSIVEDQIEYPDMCLSLRRIILMLELKSMELQPVEIEISEQYEIDPLKYTELYNELIARYISTQTLYNLLFKDELRKYIIECQNIEKDEMNENIQEELRRTKYDIIYLHPELVSFLSINNIELDDPYLDYFSFSPSLGIENDELAYANDSLNSSIAIYDIEKLLSYNDVLALDEEIYTKMLKYYANLIASLKVLSVDALSAVYLHYDELVSKYPKNQYDIAIGLIDKAVSLSNTKKEYSLNINKNNGGYIQ